MRTTPRLVAILVGVIVLGALALVTYMRSTH